MDSIAPTGTEFTTGTGPLREAWTDRSGISVDGAQIAAAQPEGSKKQPQIFVEKSGITIDAAGQKEKASRVE